MDKIKQYYDIIAIAGMGISALWLSSMIAILMIKDSINRLENKQHEMLEYMKEINEHLTILEAYVLHKMR